METTVYNAKGQEKGKIELPAFFNTEISSVLLHEITTAYLNNQRAGTHKTKTRGEVSFSGAKPWKQKGTGNARAGQRNSPLWRKGGIIFGPQPRDYFTKMSKQKKKQSLSMALAAQVQNGNIIVVDSVKFDEVKTKKVAELLKNLKVDGKKVVFAIANDASFRLAARNVKNVVVENIKNINAYQVLWADKLVITSEAIEILKERQAA
ncbi:50S ribosomal protein L4 [Endomicrobium proavitum]|uniref:Large ribosomal subunit protein uL4 n=1 Tax=Endomicrobium proavitum TaxID=1408281 RepID=A0A0G3WK42_9BACT|nr:50S ribosomal protein L4 [Endomicrobium proavitum]AKL98673.1 50S ribosomal protein L4 [Endomicrobium proavitum]